MEPELFPDRVRQNQAFDGRLDLARHFPRFGAVRQTREQTLTDAGKALVLRIEHDAIPPGSVTAGWNNLLCSLTTGLDREKNERYVDIGFMGLKGGSGALQGTDGYDHIGMIDASAIHRLSIPWTRSRWSTTVIGLVSGPIMHVPAAC